MLHRGNMLGTPLQGWEAVKAESNLDEKFSVKAIKFYFFLFFPAVFCEGLTVSISTV